MLKDLNWRSAFRRATIFTLIWLGIVYVTSVIWPQSFGIEIPEELPFLAINAVFFFFIFTLFSAFTERQRAQRAQRAQQAKSKGGSGNGRAAGSGEDDGEAGPLKGRPNPNTSRKKARRRR
ncbi:hypothetical protein [Rubrobacter aplysinae]|uniref:hypothetical protein n=1 Tax=Rubrobacter aplysinae TaxID=909625 RepID=UPI00064C25A6|nr:hypothetical protein [Rubrobacter aplysinae]